MSKKGFHGNGRYYYENGYRSKKAVRDTYSEEIIKNRIKDVLIREYNKLNASGEHDER